MRFCSYFLFLQVGPFFVIVLSVNYIVNGGFEDPILPAAGFLSNTITGWNGSHFDLSNLYTTLGYNQYVDLQ